MNTIIIDWNGDNDCCQGDVLLFRIPDSIKLDTSDEIAPRDNKLILAEGEVTGHHHAIWFSPAMFRANEGEGGIDTVGMIAKATKTKSNANAQTECVTESTRAHDAASVAQTGTAKLYRDPAAVRALVASNELTTDRLAIGILVIKGAPMILRHDEHDAIRIPVGRYYVGGQQEWDAGKARRVAD